jgi:hypothetical protein
VEVAVRDRLYREPLLAFPPAPFWRVAYADRIGPGFPPRLWQEAMLSGLRWGWRPFGGTRFDVTAVEGCLGSEDLNGVALACAVALLRLVGDDAPVGIPAWRERRTDSAAGSKWTGISPED